MAQRDGNRVRALHAPGLRLVRQVSLDSRLAFPFGSAPSSGTGKRFGLERMASPIDKLHSNAHDHQVFLYAFDLLELNGEDYRQHPLEKRKAKLEKILTRTQGMRLLRSYSHCARAD